MYSKKATPAAWIKPKPSQGLTSDLLTPRPRPNPPQKKGKGKDTSPSPTPSQSKSKEVKRLERLIDSLESGLPHSGAGREGCFCNGEIILYIEFTNETQNQRHSSCALIIIVYAPLPTLRLDSLCTSSAQPSMPFVPLSSPLTCGSCYDIS